MLLYLFGLLHCNTSLTDGYIDSVFLPQIMADAFCKTPNATIKKLIDCELWIEVEGGYQVNDFLEYNFSREEVEKRRQARSAAGRKGGLSMTGSKLSSKDEANAQANAQAKFNPITHNPYHKEKEVVDTTFFEPAKLFQAITGMAAIPGTQLDKVLPALETLWYQHGKDADGLVAYLKPFYDAWTKRKSKNGTHYSKANCSWLYDWAVAGEIPAEYVQPEAEKPRMRKLRGADGEIIEVPA